METTNRISIEMSEEELSQKVRAIVEMAIESYKRKEPSEEKAEFISKRELCELIGKSEAQIWRYEQEGIFTARKVGGRCEYERAQACYRSMFYNCTSLTAAPKLPAETLVNWCYFSMFYGCTNLSNITMLATNISADYCLDTWVDGVASTGTFTKASAMTSLPTGTSGIPEGWTVVNK